ncbi:MAG: alkaline phosphatase family protein [Nitrososphaerales archaeon]|nr:alkaline phosphatase family protein [Nitrososphaerales archaeon]
MLVVTLSFLLIISSFPLSVGGVPGKPPIQHVVIIVEENHTFDNYFGTYPGANGIAGATPQPSTNNSTTAKLVKPFMINTTTIAHDLCHDWTCAHQAYDNGSMDGFVTASNSNLTMGHFNPSLIPYYWDYASQFVLLDNFYTPVMTASLPNHLYLIAGQSGGLVGSANAGFINFTSSNVHDNTFYFKSIVDELDASHITWKYYAGGYYYLNNWNPLPGFASFKSNQARMRNLAPPGQFATDVADHKLPGVSWIMPATDEESEHPPYDISSGEQDVVSIINSVMASPYWNSTAIFLTWDDWGGWYDHVPPPQVDQFGYGFRVPCLIISPYVKQGYIDHTQGDFTSILKFVETVYSLPPLASRDASANNLMEAFDFSQSPGPPLQLPGPFVSDHYPLTFPNGTLFGGATSASQSNPATTTTTTTTTAITRVTTSTAVQTITIANTDPVTTTTTTTTAITRLATITGVQTITVANAASPSSAILVAVLLGCMVGSVLLLVPRRLGWARPGQG